MRLVWFALLLALLTCVVGCPSKPVLELHGARVESASPAGVGLKLMMRVNNDNAFDVKVRNVRASVVIAERFRLPRIQYNPDQWLPAGKWVLVPVPVVIPWQLVGPLLATSVGSNEIGYQVRGLADVTAVRMLGIRVNDQELDDEGSLSRVELLMAAGRGTIPGLR
ncbi:MAG: hypothetical protein DRI90_27155 [Deltaproteobacteria bacterium]|nr:MAG: hypothetical protein DRI90_27155 [Deltaproteobacteria bacterium]